MKNLEWYIDSIREELKKCMNGKLTGNVEFKVHFKDGGIAYMNCHQNKSIKRIENHL